MSRSANESDFRVGLEPLDAEVDADLEVTGEVPTWLTGTLVRNGAARWTARPGGQGQRLRHWFDGLAMLHRFAFRGGGVRYSNRYLRSRAYEHAVEHGRIGYTEFGTVPRRTPLQRLRELTSPPVFGNNASVNVMRLGERYVALTESPDVVPFDPVTLATGEPLSYADDVPGVVTPVHFHADADRGVLVNYTVEYGRTSAYHLYELPDPAAGAPTRRLVATVPVDRPSYMHTFSVTQRYVVLAEYPYVADPLALLLGRAPVDAYRWRPERGTRFTVVDRASGAVVARPVSDATFCWHQVGATEDGDALLLDLPVMEGGRAMRQFLLSELQGDGVRAPAGELRRFRVPLDGGPVTHRLLSATPIEFPRTADERVGAVVRRVYGVSSAESLSTSFADRLVEVDVETGAARSWSQPGCWPGEPVHVADPGSRGPDADAVLLSLVLDARARRSFLLVLDAATFTERARAQVPHAIPLGFHGQYFPELG
ncbi:carotenoid oxygenase family protein [Quadrisphaera sp. DSM 44207]|uniref:carotenoid oxygenase family protein n=1 Tax=Quadrisphaera sp. DSM 44207 TaxID=1881057 RepID=UPI000880649D|nr:carotenoid oxygenase family protein [Quadrisphaera sp. DSM 44207]SDQ70532.1 Carotenoid cleavage dioxygenase [Quadrisphaera sp. DSM 44207]